MNVDADYVIGLTEDTKDYEVKPEIIGFKAFNLRKAAQFDDILSYAKVPDGFVVTVKFFERVVKPFFDKIIQDYKREFINEHPDKIRDDINEWIPRKYNNSLPDKYTNLDDIDDDGLADILGTDDFLFCLLHGHADEGLSDLWTELNIKTNDSFNVLQEKMEKLVITIRNRLSKMNNCNKIYVRSSSTFSEKVSHISGGIFKSYPYSKYHLENFDNIKSAIFDIYLSITNIGVNRKIARHGYEDLSMGVIFQEFYDASLSGLINTNRFQSSPLTIEVKFQGGEGECGLWVNREFHVDDCKDELGDLSNVNVESDKYECKINIDDGSRIKEWKSDPNGHNYKLVWCVKRGKLRIAPVLIDNPEKARFEEDELRKVEGIISYLYTAFKCQGDQRIEFSMSLSKDDLYLLQIDNEP